MTVTAAPTVTLGRFPWTELLTPDTTRAIEFYTKVVGWTTTPWPGANPYTMWTSPRRGPVGGVMALGTDLKARGVPPHWMAHVTTPNCDETLKKVTTHGGQIKMAATDIPDVGRFGVFSDPQGGVLSAFTPNQSDMPEPPGEPGIGEFVWHELAVADARKAFDFYHSVFGWEKTGEMEMGPGNIYQMFGLGGRAFGGMYNLDPNTHRPPSWLHYIEVADVDRAATQIPQLGGNVMNPPMDVPNGRIVVATDPQGAVFALHTAKGH